MKRTLNQQLQRLSRKEQKLLSQNENPIMKSTVSPVVDKIQEKIPPKLKSTLDAVFYKGFQLVFDKGRTYIEKTYNKDKIQLEYDIINYGIDRTTSAVGGIINYNTVNRIGKHASIKYKKRYLLHKLTEQ